MSDMNELAIQAKTDEYALEQIIKLLTPMCRTIARRYASPAADYDELMQWCRIEIWKAVDTYQPERGKTFFSYCNMSTRMHISRFMVRRYGPKESTLYLKSFRFDKPVIAEDGHEIDWALEDREARIEAILSRRDGLKSIRELLYSTPLSPLEQRCMRLFYFEDQTYEQIVEREKLNSTKTVDNALARVRRKIAANPWLREEYYELVAQ